MIAALVTALLILKITIWVYIIYYIYHLLQNHDVYIHIHI
jgi:hypothetical protein